METTYSFEDVLTGATVACGYPNLRSHYVGKAQGAMECESVFFPGCSFINYGLPLVQAVFDTLKQGGCVQGMSLLCCGKILSYEPNGKEVRASFEQQLRQHLLASGVKRLVAACPNCVKALRDACAADSATAEIEVVPLPQELARLGYRIDPTTAQALMAAEVPEGARVVFCPHDSCPDRATGEFADGMRTLAENIPLEEPVHNRKKSMCCGSLARAAGNYNGAVKGAQMRAEEAVQAQANVLMTACVSCSFLLNTAQNQVPAAHYLELLYNWRIDWAHADQYMKLRFLFDDVPQGEQSGGRAFVSLEQAEE